MLQRHDNLLKTVIEGRMEGRRGRGRKRIGMLDDLIKDEHYAHMKRRADDRAAWRSWMPEPVYNRQLERNVG